MITRKIVCAIKIIVPVLLIVSLLGRNVSGVSYYYSGAYNSIHYSDISTTKIYSGASVVSGSYDVVGANAVNHASEWIFNPNNMGSGSVYSTTTTINASFYPTHGHCVVSRINGNYTFSSKMWQDD